MDFLCSDVLETSIDAILRDEHMLDATHQQAGQLHKFESFALKDHWSCVVECWDSLLKALFPDSSKVLSLWPRGGLE